MRHAIELRMHVNLILDDIYESYQQEERLELVEKAVREKVNDINEENGK